ncbi:MAG TPA: bifunctional transaldolase/phosoglucose isomerase [Anaerolineales bacterium]|nr:bifunctional transaldolase/phosoglucose isomerase [Anaerolineales bacterium]HNC07277.1 bifunctional transaldolase/phosoglucose isomerase [Anaerolineales bacterium]
MSESIKKLTNLGQSLWYDNIQRKLLVNGELKAMIERGDIRGVTSNPTIFQNAIAKTNDYDAALTPLAWAGWDAEKIFWQLAIEDIQEACDLFRPLYEESKAGDGYVSLEVSPYLARDTEGTIKQAQELWDRVNRPNLMVKIPATKEGIPAIRASIAAGINVNVTLIFSLSRYAEVMNAYLEGIEQRVAKDLPVQHVASVASFFVSRVDSKVDPKLAEDSPLRGKAAVANAKLAYEQFEAIFTSPRFASLKARFRARVQRPLWASTGTKNPKYSDTLYVDELIGPDTVNTVPPATLDAFRDHGIAKLTVTQDLEGIQKIFVDLKALGISMSTVVQELEDEGVQAFADAFKTLLAAIEERRKTAASSLGTLADSVSVRLSQLEQISFPKRFWNHDVTLWSGTDDPEGQAEAAKRLGWLDSIEDARKRLDGYLAFAKQVHDEKIDRVLVIGMGGSSLTAEVLSSLLAQFGVMAKLSLAILDSTDPQQVAQAFEDYPPDKSLYIVASKSGGTAELMAAFDYIWKLSNGNGSRFIVTTDAGTSLQKLAEERGFRKVFNADPNVGGRFSALTDFGLVPAALLGMDFEKLLGSAERMRKQSLADMPAARNPGMALGALIAESALMGRDKLTVLADAQVSALAGWVEQVIAESSGKHGKGILPVALEPLGKPEEYGNDRLFVYLKSNGELEAGIVELKKSGFPVIEFPVKDPYDLGAEFFRWEIAISTACSILSINAFDQPDVQDSKLRTIAKIKDYQTTGKLAEADLVDFKDAQKAIDEFLADPQAGEFVTINAYLPRNAEMIEAIQSLRTAIRARTKLPVTAGFGPRFQHSTGQFHKGGPNKGRFIQFVYDAEKDMDIPGQGLTFGTLIRAQALGDYEALKAAGRKALRIRLSKPDNIKGLL